MIPQRMEFSRARTCAVLETAIGAAGAAAIADALTTNTTVTKLNLDGESVPTAARCFRVNVFLCSYLRASTVGTGNDIGETGAAMIAHALKLNTTVTNVSLSGESARAGEDPLACCGSRSRVRSPTTCGQTTRSLMLVRVQSRMR